ncbi:MAG TPA: hypothetical protein PKC97_00920 [Burkholderiaceae bacterium]|nr:hypothetical protein [Burkholderiaceae bacterium]
MLLERFITADCEVCWRGGDTPSGTPLALDWIVPSPRGDDAPLAAAALPEAGVRAGTIAQTATTSRRHVLPSGAGLSLRVEQGPPFNGYIAAQVDVERDAARGGRPAPSGAVAYLALVEQVRAGEEGATVQRMLVRAVVGPLPLDPDRSGVAHLHAFRVPQGSRPARLVAVGWAEAPGGRVIAAARVEPDACLPAR